MSSLDLIITHDTEDVYTPAEEGMDRVPMALADILTEEGVPGHFIVVAERARVLKERGRTDVIAALRRQSIGVHTLYDGQPYDAVLAAGLDWAGGMEVCRRMHGEAHRTVTEIFDCQPVCLSAHACNAAPQQQAVAHELGVPYLYSYAAVPPLNSMSRYCGSLGITCFYARPGEVMPYFSSFDDRLSDEPSFVEHLERFAQFIDKCIAQGQPVLLLHPCHPFKVYCLDWVDYYVSPDGANIPHEEWPRRRKPGIRSAAEVELALRNYRRLIRFIRHHPQLNVITIPEAAAKYGRVPAEIGRLDLLAAAQRVCALHEVALDQRFSPAELALAFAGALLAFARDARLPEAVSRENEILGPVEDPLFTPTEPGKLGWLALLELAEALKQAAAASGHLPANLTVRGGRAGLGSVYHALAQAYLAVCQDGRPPDGVDLWRFDREPRIGPEVGDRFATLADSPVVEPNLNVSNLRRYGKLQTWTLAPAARSKKG